MKMHTDTLTAQDIRNCLDAAKSKGHVARDIHFETFDIGRSRSRVSRFEIQLGTYDKTSGPGKSRKFKNPGGGDRNVAYAATYDEWGWFIAEVFDLDANAIFGPYDGQAEFHLKTRTAYAD